MTRPDDPRTAAARVFAEGGAFGELLAEIDWATTPLGPPVSWPGPLVDTLRLMLTSEHEMALYWGAEFTTLYNLDSVPIVGAKHPWALGRPYKEVFPEVWAHPVSSHFHYVTGTRKPLLVPDELLIIERHDFLEVLASAVAGALSAALAHEEQRRRAEALAELDRAKTTFFANVSHDSAPRSLCSWARSSRPWPTRTGPSGASSWSWPSAAPCAC